MILRVEMTPEVRQELEESGEVRVVGVVSRGNGEVLVGLEKATRVAIVEEMLVDRGKRKGKGFRETRIVPSLEESQIVMLWNSRGAEKNYEGRNKPASLKCVTDIKAVRKTLAAVGFETLKAEITAYFDYCFAGKHLRGSINYAYSSIQRFLSVFLDEDFKAWWHLKDEVEDPYPDHTQFFADEFAIEFLAAKGLALQKGTKDWDVFVTGARHLLELEDCPAVHKSYEDLVTMVLSCLRKTMYGDRLVIPSRSLNPSFWSVIFPQHLKEVLGLPPSTFDELGR